MRLSMRLDGRLHRLWQWGNPTVGQGGGSIVADFAANLAGLPCQRQIPGKGCTQHHRPQCHLVECHLRTFRFLITFHVHERPTSSAGNSVRSRNPERLFHGLRSLP